MPRFIVTVEGNGNTMPYRVEARDEKDACAQAEMNGYKVRGVERELPPLMPGTATTPPTAPGPVMPSPVASAAAVSPQNMAMINQLRSQKSQITSQAWMGAIVILLLAFGSCFFGALGVAVWVVAIVLIIAISMWETSSKQRIDMQIAQLGGKP